jgi:hypothetical protein
MNRPQDIVRANSKKKIVRHEKLENICSVFQNGLAFLEGELEKQVDLSF